jgi:hypothetical protein
LPFDELALLQENKAFLLRKALGFAMQHPACLPAGMGAYTCPYHLQHTPPHPSPPLPD